MCSAEDPAGDSAGLLYAENHIAPIGGEIKDQEWMKQMALAARRREGLAIQRNVRIGIAMEQRPKGDHGIAEARVTVEEMHSHMMNCRVLAVVAS